VKAETCELMKTYLGRHSVVYSGYADENGIWGKMDASADERRVSYLAEEEWCRG